MFVLSIVSVILSGLVFLWGIFSFKMLHTQNKEILELEKKLDSSNYVFHRKIDLEMTLYMEFSKHTIKLEKSIYKLFPIFDNSPFAFAEGKEKDEIAKSMRKDALVNLDNLSDMLYSNEAFITSVLFNELEEFINVSKYQISIFTSYYLRKFEEILNTSEKNEGISVYDRSKKIVDMRKKISLSYKDRLNTIIGN